MRTEVARRRTAGVPDDQLGSIENGQGQLDELFVPVDGVQRAANVVAISVPPCCSTQFVSSMMAASRASWFSLILDSREGSRSEFGIGVPPWSEQRSSWVAWRWIVSCRQDAGGGANQFPNKEDRPHSTRSPEGVFCVGFGSKYLYRSQPAYVSRSDCKSAYAGSIPTSASTIKSP